MTHHVNNPNNLTPPIETPIPLSDEVSQISSEDTIQQEETVMHEEPNKTEIIPTDIIEETIDFDEGTVSSKEDSKRTPTLLETRQISNAKNIVEEYKVFHEVDDKKWKDDEVTLALAQDRQDIIEESIQSIGVDEVNLIANEASREHWASIAAAAIYTNQVGGFFDDVFDRPGSEWHQTVKTDGRELKAGSPKFSDTSETNLTGDKAVMHVNQLLGLGGLFTIPLWHSGFWITIKAPHDSEILELHRRITSDKISLGRRTYGMVYSNTSVYYVKAVMDFVFAHIFSCSLKCSREDLPKHISSLDIETLVWGVACGIWPKGFQYSRSVLLTGEDGVTSQKEIRGLLDVSKLFRYDVKALTAWQTKHMLSRNNTSMGVESLERYRNEFSIGGERVVNLRDGVVKIVLRVPSLDEYITAGYTWVDGISNMVMNALGMEADDNVRNSYINEQGKASALRQYVHWVKQVETQSDKQIVDRESIERTFDSLSQDDEIRTSFLDEVKKYMEDSQISVVGTPCATADEEKKYALPRFPHLYPLNTMATFFTLLVQKVGRITSRA